MFIHEFGENLPHSFFEILKFLPRFTRDISKFQKGELGKFIPNFPLKHVITSTNNKLNLVSRLSNYIDPRISIFL